MNENNEYIENKQTKIISKLCNDAGCQKCLCHIWKWNLYFNDPKTPYDCGFWFSYKDGKWLTTCRTTDPWYEKIYKGLCKYFPNGIEDLLDYSECEKALSDV